MDGLAKFGGATLAMAGLLHMSGFLIAEWNVLTAQLFAIGLLYVCLGVLTFLGRAGLRWIAAIASALGLIAAVQVMPTPLVPGTLMWVFVLLDVVAIGFIAASIQKSLISA